MLIWVCALHCEAKPVIDFYRLKKSHDDRAFDLYRGEDMTCVVSGIGKTASAAACAWIAGMLADEPSPAWINLGVAGAAEHEIGALFALDKIVDADNGLCFYPAPIPLPASPPPGSACLTLSQAGQDYREDMLFDMEASGFMQSALRFSSAELTQSLKVISDNRQHQCGRDRRRVSELIADRFDSVAIQASALLELQRELATLEPAADAWQRLLGMAHFTQTQKNRLRVLWRYLSNRDLDIEALLLESSPGRSASAIIRTLEAISHRDSENL